MCIRDSSDMTHRAAAAPGNRGPDGRRRLEFGPAQPERERSTVGTANVRGRDTNINPAAGVGPGLVGDNTHFDRLSPGTQTRENTRTTTTTRVSRRRPSPEDADTLEGVSAPGRPSPSSRDQGMGNMSNARPDTGGPRAWREV